jgi:hypothetical protein
MYSLKFTPEMNIFTLRDNSTGRTKPVTGAELNVHAELAELVSMAAAYPWVWVSTSQEAVNA